MKIQVLARKWFCKLLARNNSSHEALKVNQLELYHHHPAKSTIETVETDVNYVHIWG